MGLENTTENDSCLERGIIYGAATSLEYFEAIRDQVKPALSQYAGIIFSWISDYYTANHKLPEDIYNLYQVKKAGLKKPATAHMVAKIIESLRDEYPEDRPFDAALMIPETRKYCEMRRLEIGMERAHEHLEARGFHGGHNRIAKSG